MTPPLDPTPATPTDAAIRARQRTRSIATASVLFALVILFFAISIAKMIR